MCVRAETSPVVLEQEESTELDVRDQGHGGGVQELPEELTQDGRGCDGGEGCGEVGV